MKNQVETPIERATRYMTPEKDFRFENHGSIVLMFPLSEAAKAWTDENVEDGMHYNGALVIEPRLVSPIIDGIREEGLSF